MLKVAEIFIKNPEDAECEGDYYYTSFWEVDLTAYALARAVAANIDTENKVIELLIDLVSFTATLNFYTILTEEDDDEATAETPVDSLEFDLGVVVLS